MNAGAAIMLLGSFFLPQETVYRWQSYTVAGDQLYAVKTVSTNALNVPIPERGATEVLDKKYQIVVIDLKGRKKVAVPVDHHLQPKQPVGKGHLEMAFGYYEYIELNENVPPVLWGRKELKERLAQAGHVDCAESEIGDVIYDHQDSRVLYLYCAKRAVAYRIELPSMRAVAIPLGAVAGLPSDSGPDFFSTSGQKTIFVKVNGETYELGIESKDRARKIERIENNLYSPKTRAAKSLIGVAEELRIYQITQLTDKSAELSVEYGQQAPRKFPLPTAIVTSGSVKAMYLPRNNSVMWEVYGEIKGKVVIYSLNLDSGVVGRVEVIQVE